MGDYLLGQKWNWGAEQWGGPGWPVEVPLGDTACGGCRVPGALPEKGHALPAPVGTRGQRGAVLMVRGRGGREGWRHSGCSL